MFFEAGVVYSRVLHSLFIGSRLQVHKIHHPVSINLYYEGQKAEALRAAEQFRASRLPKFFKHFQSVLETNNVLYSNAMSETTIK